MRWLLLCALVGCYTSPPTWHVADGFLRDPEGRAVIMRGVNLSGAQKNAPYLDDKQPADYARVRDAWGMNAVRFLMTWAAVEPAEGQYDDAYLDAVAERIGWAAVEPDEGRYDDAYLDGVAERLRWSKESGLSVVLEMHEDIYGEGFGFDGAPRWSCDPAHYAAFVPRTPWYLNAADPEVQACIDDFYTIDEHRQHFIAAWRHVAERLAAHTNVIGFDVLNEPNWGSYPLFRFEADRLAPFYGEVVKAVRAAAPHWIAFLEPGASRNLGFATNLTAFPFRDVVYSPHSYDANAESGAGFDPAHRQMILDNVQTLSDEAHALKAGLWIGEYGGDPSQPGIVEYMTAQYDAAAAVAGSTMYWAYDKSDGYGLLDPAGNEKPELLGVLVRPYPERVAGDPGSYAFDAASRTFTLTYTPHGHATTEISVPDRVYPTGYQVDCGGCASHSEAGLLVIDTPATTVVVHP